MMTILTGVLMGISCSFVQECYYIVLQQRRAEITLSTNFASYSFQNRFEQLGVGKRVPVTISKALGNGVIGVSENYAPFLRVSYDSF